MKRWSVFVSFVLFIALCISATFWAMRLFKTPVRAVVAPPQEVRQEIKLDAAAALFGGRPSSVAVASNYQLKGVVVANPPEDSVAILSTDGKPPQAIAMNMEVNPGVTVKEVHAKYVLLSEGGITKRVELPEGTQQLRLDTADNAQAPIQPAQTNQPAPMMAPPRVAPPRAVPPMPQVNGVFNMEAPRGRSRRGRGSQDE